MGCSEGKKLYPFRAALRYKGAGTPVDSMPNPGESHHEENRLWVCSFAQTYCWSQSGTQNAFTPNQIKWGPPPPYVPAGAKLALSKAILPPALETSRSASKCPADTGSRRIGIPTRKRHGDFRQPQSRHGRQIRRVANGDVPAGSFGYLDPDMHHYAMAASAAMVQIHGMSPVQFNYVNPADDPSKK